LKARTPGRRTRASSSFGNNGAPPNRPSASPRLDGLHVQWGGDRLIACAEGSEDDRAWFERNHARSHRIRFPIGGERRIKREYPRGFAAMVVVRQVKPGARLRVSFGWRGSTPLNSERFARDAFEAATAHRPWVAEFERRIREQTP
jgi:hypothetical protein